MSSSTKIDNRRKDILILVKGSTQGLEHTLSAEKMYFINFTEHNEKFGLSLHYNGANSYLFVNGKEIHKFKAKDSEIVATPLCLGNISKDWTVDNMKKTGLNGYVYDFSVCYDAFEVDGTFFTVLAFLPTLTSVNLLSCISMNNQECKIRRQIVNVNSEGSIFFPFSIKTNKCSGSCNNINNPYAKLCVLDIVKNLIVKVFNLMSRNNEKRHIEWLGSCKSECRLDASVCNNKQRWNDDKCRCKSKKLIDKGVCDKVSIWNPSNCECECNKSCDVGEYLDYENCKCNKKLIDKLTEECTENVKEVKLAKITSTENETPMHFMHTVCTLCCLQYLLKLMLELAAIFFVFICTEKKMLFVLS